VRVLLDEQLPRQLARELSGHDVAAVQQLGWAGVTNGELLRRAAAQGIDVLLTADQNLEFQQNLSGAALGVVVVRDRGLLNRTAIPNDLSGAGALPSSMAG
jgi:predicted nuclease of predicted toxin-antitoxin system